MPIPNDYKDIVKALSVKTEEGNVGWGKDKFDVSITVDNTNLRSGLATMKNRICHSWPLAYTDRMGQ